jgi:hypothetical protein
VERAGTLREGLVIPMVTRLFSYPAKFGTKIKLRMLPVPFLVHPSGLW